MNYADDCLTRFPTLWSATVRERDPSVVMPGDVTGDVAVIGAGYTGLCAALTLAEAGLSVAVVDGAYPGWGASGRNSGAVIRGFHASRSKLIDAFGAAQGRRMADFGAGVAESLYETIERYAIDCDLKRTGWILPAHNEAGLRRVAERQRSWTADGHEGLDMLEPSDVKRMLGTNAYVGGMIDRLGASLNPLAYARGLARAACGQGARIFRETLATSISREGGGWCIETPRGRVRAKRVILATDAYSKGLVRQVDTRLATIHTNIVATGPLAPQIGASILPGEQAVSDSRRILYYWHKDPEGRVLFGTRGSLKGPRSVNDFSHVEAALHSIYPQLRDVPIEFRWSGKVGLTRDFLPHIDQPKRGLWTGYGYCGRGVAMASAFGRLLGETIVEDRALTDLPVPQGKAPSLPPAPLRDLGVVGTTGLYRLLDRIA